MELVINRTIFSWQTKQWQELTNRLANNRLPHALLLAGSKGLGKYQFAQTFAHVLLCEENQSHTRICKQCPGCQLLAGQTHPDFKIIQPEENSETIKIDQIRDLIEFYQQKAAHGAYKISIIYPAEAMNQAAANALLKTLEEPPLNNNLLLLVSDQLALLLATIRSRCQLIEFKIPSQMEASTWLKQSYPEEVNLDIALKLAEGAPLLASNIIAEQKLKEFEELLIDINKLLQQEQTITAVAQKWQSKDIHHLLYILQFILVRIIETKLLTSNFIPSKNELMRNIDNIAQYTILSRLFSCLDYIYEQKRSLQTKINLNNTLVLEKIFSFF